MLTTDTNFKVWVNATPKCYGHTNQRTDTFVIKNFEGIVLEKSLIKVGVHDSTFDIVSAEAKVIWVKSLVPKLKKSAC